MPKVSVWLTSYNHGEFIGQSIQSILDQTYEDYELLIMDDCSTDNSWEIICQYAQKDARIRPFRHEVNQGSSGMSDMLDEFRGEYVAIAHCDDLWCPTKLEKQVQILEKHDEVAACFTLVQVIDDEGNAYGAESHVYSKVFEQGTNRTRYEWLRHFFYERNCLCHPSLLIRKKAYTEMGILTDGLSGLPDFCQWIRLCKQAEIFVLQEKLTKFRVHQNGTNTSGDSAASNNRVYVEEWFVFREYLSLIESGEVVKVFPEADIYIVDGKISQKYALAQIFFAYPQYSYKLFGLQLLYEIFQDKEQEKEIAQLYGYTRRSYDADKKKYDIFRVIPENRYMAASVYLKGEAGYSEELKITAEVYVQQTGAFSVCFDLKNYPIEMLHDMRVDLDEGRYRKFRLCTCECADSMATYELVNGVHEGEWDVFYTMDPQYYFTVEQGGVLRIAGYTEELLCNEIELFNQRLWNRCVELEEEISRMKNTKVWILRNKILKLLGK